MADEESKLEAEFVALYRELNAQNPARAADFLTELKQAADAACVRYEASARASS